VKIGVIVGAIALLIGGGSWLAAEEWGGNSAAAQKMQGTSAIVAPAASQPALDLSAPDKVMAAFCEALRSGDRDRTYACLVADPKRPPTPIDGMLSLNLAMNRVVVESQKKFGPQATAASMGLLGIDAVGEMISDASAGATASKVDGDTAELSATVPPEMIELLPRNAQKIVQIWSGAPIRMKKIGSQWRFDVDRSMKVLLTGKKAANVTAEDETAAFTDGARVLDGLAGDIRDGKVETLGAARAMVRQDIQQVMARHGLAGTQTTVVPADYAAAP